MSTHTETELDEIWKFVNVWFGLDFPSNVVSVAFGKYEEITKDKPQEHFNEMEKEAHKQIKPEDLQAQTDAQICFRIGKKWKLKPLVCIYTDRLNGKNQMYQEFLRNHHSRKDYITFLLIHEFIHALEHLTKRQLLTEPTLDLKIWRTFHG